MLYIIYMHNINWHVYLMLIIMLSLYILMHVQSDGHRFRNLMLFGDQLTVERAIADQKARIASDTAVKAPDGLEPPATDRHAEASFLQVSMHAHPCTHVHVVMIERDMK